MASHALRSPSPESSPATYSPHQQPTNKTPTFLRRLGSSILLWSVVLWALFSEHPGIAQWVFLAIMTILATAGLAEFYALAARRGLPSFRVCGLCAGLLLMIGTFLHCTGKLGIHNSPARVNDFETSFLILFVLGLALRLLAAGPTGNGLSMMAVSLLGLFYVPWLLNFIQKIHFFPGINGLGKFYVLYFVVVTKLSDTGAYVVGSLCGRHKLAPKVSPGKTWEGFAGALVFSLVAGVALAEMLDHRLPGMNLFHATLLGLTLGAGAVLGDLIESLLKREAGVKDSGRWFPGIGGLLDLLDSLLFNAPLMYLYLRHVLSRP
ncbi:MAG: phosphatidate cytidylyltransferase [Limisphaera sp.]|nr:phosphatidate cytidylyltransferase [Limisphaera sp.]